MTIKYNNQTTWYAHEAALIYRENSWCIYYIVALIPVDWKTKLVEQWYRNLKVQIQILLKSINVLATVTQAV